MKQKDLIEFIPLGILSLLAIASIFEVVSTTYAFLINQYVGLTLLGFSIVLFFSNRRIYRYIFGITLVLGLFNLIGFTTFITTINLFGLVIQPLLVPIIPIFIWINKEKIKPIIRSLAGTNEEQIINSEQTKINGFKRRFKNLSDNEINSKLQENLIPEAIEALKQIKKERLDNDLNT